MSGDELILELTAQWWHSAQGDLVTAREASVPFARGFHCQQSVEKAIKCLLVRHQIDFPQSHDIGELLKLLEPVLPLPVADRAAIEALTRFAVRTRYPPLMPTQQEVDEALVRATRFLKWGDSLLPSDVSAFGQER